MSRPPQKYDPAAEFTADEALAIDWAIGALSEAERARAEDRRATDPRFADLCAIWAERLAEMTDDIELVSPPEGLWDRIDQQIGADRQPRAAAQKVDPTATAKSAGSGAWWNSLWLWRGAAAGFAALALGLLVVRPVTPDLRPAETVDMPEAGEVQRPVSHADALLSAMLASEGGRPLIAAAVDSSRGSVLVVPIDGPELDGQVPELWLIPPDGKPRSLGVIDLGGTRAVVIPPTLLQLAQDGAILAVSLEPVGGSPTGQPTGPVVATGKLQPAA